MEAENEVNALSGIFDVKQFLQKLLKLWWLFLICMAIGLGYAYYKNQFIQTFYRIESLISIKDNNNPLFTSNQSLTFNWGGTTDKVTTAIIQFKSRSHAEVVVDQLQYYVNYIKEGDYYNIDAYKQTPFFVFVDTSYAQLYQKNIRIKVLDNDRFELSAPFSGTTAGGFDFVKKEWVSVETPQGEWQQIFEFGEEIDLPFLHITIERTSEQVKTGEWLFNLGNYWGTVMRYKGIAVSQQPTGSSILSLSMQGLNKKRLIDYINKSSEVLVTEELRKKNKFAVSTIKYIDSSLQQQSKLLKESETELAAFRDNTQLIDATSQSTDFNSKLTGFEIQKRDLLNRLNYYETLDTYLKRRSDYTAIQAPSIVGITEGSIGGFIGQLIGLSEERKRLEFSLKPDAPAFRDIDRQIDALKTVIYENIDNSTSLLENELGQINREIGRLESQIKRLPKEQQEFLKIQRQFDITQQAYNVFQAKRAEAELVKAANVSDVYIIDEAKDTGQGGSQRDTNINYLIALLIGIAIPVTVAFVLTLLDTFIHSPKELERLSPVPLIGVIGQVKHDNNLVVFEKPRSAIAEAFRGLRSSLHFIYNQDTASESKTIMVTSSVSGEGKTFTSINLATVFALSGKRTILVGLDLRKPKIFDDFNIDNTIGVSNYLVKDATLNEIVKSSGIENLDLALSGPVPPNPSELILNKQTAIMLEELKQSYDYVILDTPPLGLVADAMEISKHSDASLYVVRQGYTKKGMLDILNDKYSKQELGNVSMLFNYFNDRARYGHGYGYGYGYGAYGNGYHQDSAPQTAAYRLKTRIKQLFSLSRKRN
ncbi:protein involved in gliding motility EpsB [Nonlabens sp. Hel1_33_55]|uniref:polysaccharide biosynthesis tyrosine autokinase n=1 Tax=Nonlabens sp. Hel1_33_55 TaxID=1336802 RepID=UPI000875C604|nr:polysaccharide biosynthesis tyrosine autokinase [Nonlabens sp. Hel1_33_55]SCX91967.1 protein involved in gliding motility EpsB [Nonlabens sp. Hel1_33_55]